MFYLDLFYLSNNIYSFLNHNVLILLDLQNMHDYYIHDVNDDELSLELNNHHLYFMNYFQAYKTKNISFLLNFCCLLMSHLFSFLCLNYKIKSIRRKKSKLLI